MKVTKPRKAVWVMRDFVNAVSDLEHIVEGDFDGEKYTNVITAKRTAKFIKGRHFATSVCDPLWAELEEHIVIFYNFHDLWDWTMKDFRKDFVSRCPMAQGFANVTLTLLHELGHNETNVQFKERNKAHNENVDRFKKGEIDKHDMQFLYFRFPDEMAATDWAIEWLKDAEHRKIAKDFEKEFFKCVKK